MDIKKIVFFTKIHEIKLNYNNNNETLFVAKSLMLPYNMKYLDISCLNANIKMKHKYLTENDVSLA